MNIYVGLTDSAWHEFLSRHRPDEVNFWRPKDNRAFRALTAGEPFLFKLHRPKNYIVGGGFFVSHTRLPLSIVWDVFGVNNGAANFADFAEQIDRYRQRSRGFEPDPIIGCVVLTNPFFFPEGEWIDEPENWSANLIQGKTYKTEEPAGARLWSAVSERLLSQNLSVTGQRVPDPLPTDDSGRYGEGQIVAPRLGQGGFRVLVTEAYSRRCAITGERTLPVLQAAHIKPYSELGPHRVDNGLLLRSDLHILFDGGFLTITPDYTVEVSKRIRKEYENGRDYYKLHGRQLVTLPLRSIDRPSREFIEYHNNKRFAA